MSENYTAGKNFTLPPAMTAWTNLTSVSSSDVIVIISVCVMVIINFVNRLTRARPISQRKS